MTHQANKGPNAEPERFRQLTESANRLATTLSLLSINTDSFQTGVGRPGKVQAPPVELVRNVIRLRRIRSKIFPEELFADPAWDILLVLFLMDLEGREIAVSPLCEAADAPPSTVLRWIRTLAERGLVIRRPDIHDGRRILVELTPHARELLCHFFADLQATLQI